MDPQYKDDLHSYLQLVDDETEENMLSIDDDEEEEDDGSVGSDEDSDDASIEDDEVESDEMECEVDEEFRKEIKLALGNAALPTSEVCLSYSSVTWHNVVCSNACMHI